MSISTHRVVARYGQARTDDFFRFFPLAGMGHCGGGPGFSHIGGATGAPIKDDADHDMVRALDQWVTKNQAPSLFIGAHINDAKEVTATRPICRYPLEARYTGRGDSKRAENFTCRAPSNQCEQRKARPFGRLENGTKQLMSRP